MLMLSAVAMLPAFLLIITGKWAAFIGEMPGKSQQLYHWQLSRRFKVALGKQVKNATMLYYGVV